MSIDHIVDSQALTLVGAWLFYFVLHSILASLGVKRWVACRWPNMLPAYRLLFNALALLLLLPPLYLLFTWEGPWLWRWSGFGWWLVNALALAALFGFYWSLRYYDSAEFIGLKQWRERLAQVEDQEAFHLSPLHRYVRHPWYALGILLVWTRDMNGGYLLSSLAITLYFLVGSRLEESKLLAYHGRAYQAYRERVPGLVPRPWRYLTKQQAEEILAHGK